MAETRARRRLPNDFSGWPLWPLGERHFVPRATGCHTRNSPMMVHTFSYNCGFCPYFLEKKVLNSNTRAAAAPCQPARRLRRPRPTGPRAAFGCVPPASAGPLVPRARRVGAVRGARRARPRALRKGAYCPQEQRGIRHTGREHQRSWSVPAYSCRTSCRARAPAQLVSSRAIPGESTNVAGLFPS